MPARKKLLWETAIEKAADPERAAKYFKNLSNADALSPEQVAVLALLFSGSEAMSDVLLAHPEWLSILNDLDYPRRKPGLANDLQTILDPVIQQADFNQGWKQLRSFKQREMLRLTARDLARKGPTPEILLELSNLADVCLNGALKISLQQLSNRYGMPYYQDTSGKWRQSGFAIIGLGKLGGQELNYSSDVDLMFVYPEEGFVFKEAPKAARPPQRAMTSHQFYNRLAELIVSEVSRLTPEGMLYRVDMRLRPEGEAGPLTRSLAGYENFYAQWGQTWERMMLIKARCVAGDVELGHEFNETLQHFRYPRYLGEGALREIADMKARFENEVIRSGELDRNIKLGRGGIREIEFIVQTQQLLHGGRNPFLQNPQTLPGLQKLVQYHLLKHEEAKTLAEAYLFLRDLEHRLQMDRNLQTHTMPVDGKSLDRLARLMGFADRESFQETRSRYAAVVRRIYEQTLKTESSPPPAPFPKEISGQEERWKTILREHRFRDPDKALRTLQEFALGPGYVHVSNRTTELAFELIPRFFTLCLTSPSADGRLPNPKVLSDPDRVLTRLDQFISAYGTRSMLFEMWNSNPSLFELLLLLFDCSEFLAETAIRTPDMVDELMLSGRLRRSKNAKQILADLRHGSKDEDQQLWLRQYHETEFMRIGLRDILGLADGEQVVAELSALADACLQYALEVALRRHKIKTVPFAIIGLGKLGGQEIIYGSDLDIIFVAPAKAKDVPKLQRVAVDILDLLSARTTQGIVFETDARLRPDGEKGLLVNTLDRYEAYYRERAQLWEIQAIMRSRTVAGNESVGEKFRQLSAALTNFTLPQVKAGFPSGSKLKGLAAYTPEWKAAVARMRLRIEKERTPAGLDHLAIKTGSGGLIDAEFLAQALCLQNGWQEANTLKALHLAHQSGALSAPDATKLIENYAQLRRIERILRRWSFEGETVLPTDAPAQYRVAVRCGWGSAADFLKEVARIRKGIRDVYNRVMSKA